MGKSSEGISGTGVVERVTVTKENTESADIIGPQVPVAETECAR